VWFSDGKNKRHVGDKISRLGGGKGENAGRELVIGLATGLRDSNPQGTKRYDLRAGSHVTAKTDTFLHGVQAFTQAQVGAG
jgi:hypothetical protein